MDKVRVTVQTSFTYQYGSKVNHLICGAILYFNPSLDKELDELKYVMSSVYLERGFLSVEESIKQDYKNKAGIFAKKISGFEEPSTINTAEEKELDSSVETISLEDRKNQLEDMRAAEVRTIAEELGLEEYTNKTAAIEYILNVEYPE